jgi:DNA-binding response OmpR family regulator
MLTRGRILIADDEQTFLSATADLLRREGYDVDTAGDGAAALERIGDAAYDLLITDLEMPGNADLSLVREVAASSGGVPIIIITGFPSTHSAIAAIDLPVTAYLLKPVRFEQLLPRVAAAVGRFRQYQAMRRTEERLAQWQADVQRIVPADGRPAPAVDAFLALTLRNVMGSLTDLEQLGQALAGAAPDAHPCQLLNCPRGARLQDALRQTVAVLEETKGAFKSKALGELRRKLEPLLEPQ